MSWPTDAVLDLEYGIGIRFLLLRSDQVRQGQARCPRHQRKKMRYSFRDPETPETESDMTTKEQIWHFSWKMDKSWFLKTLVAYAGITQRDLAKKVGINPTRVNGILMGRIKMRDYEHDKLFDYLDEVRSLRALPPLQVVGGFDEDGEMVRGSKPVLDAYVNREEDRVVISAESISQCLTLENAKKLARKLGHAVRELDKMTKERRAELDARRREERMAEREKLMARRRR